MIDNRTGYIFFSSGISEKTVTLKYISDSLGTEAEKIIITTELLLKDQSKYNEMSRAINPYGDGKASENILNFIKKNLYWILSKT